ncbi:hypothetical protein [Ensifer adhaerens]|uniref:hypothetical protein n=1 Tax=Ensifer adhaerens TaxID=106592 RepID=UPI00131A15E9|nr:hypothetical protein [Ensifer adhaerens]
MALAGPRAQPDALLSAAQSLGIAGNPISQLLYAIGVSCVFYVEYRFSAWRNLVPRAGRIPLLAAKFGVCLLCMAAGLVLTLAAAYSSMSTLSKRCDPRGSMT